MQVNPIGVRMPALLVRLTAALAVLSVGFISVPQRAEAHCDSIYGPVVSAARYALETGDAHAVLPYVPASAETELTEALRRAMQVRRLGGEARDLADRWFFETAVRLHRAGEGAPYTGLTEQRDFGPAITAAELTLMTGSLDPVHAVLIDAIHHGLVERYEHVLAARALAAREGTLAAQRERVEAELSFEQYVDELYHLTLGVAVTHERSTAKTVVPDRCPRATDS